MGECAGFLNGLLLDRGRFRGGRLLLCHNRGPCRFGAPHAIGFAGRTLLGRRLEIVRLVPGSLPASASVLGHVVSVQPAQLDGDVFIDGAGVRLLLGDAQFGEPVQNFVSLDFQLPRQLVDPNLLHRQSNLLPLAERPTSPLECHRPSGAPSSGAVPSGPSTDCRVGEPASSILPNCSAISSVSVRLRGSAPGFRPLRLPLAGFGPPSTGRPRGRCSAAPRLGVSSAAGILELAVVGVDRCLDLLHHGPMPGISSSSSGVMPPSFSMVPMPDSSQLLRPRLPPGRNRSARIPARPAPPARPSAIPLPAASLPRS